MILQQCNARLIAEISQAMVDGKQIQYRIRCGESWTDIESVHVDQLFRFPERFRVKPAAVKVVTVFGSTASYVFDSRHYNDAVAAAMSYCARNKINYQQHAQLNEFEV